MSVGPADPSRGVLFLSQALQAFQMERPPPHDLLSPWIENYWEVAWNLPEGRTHRQTNLSHSAINVAVEGEDAWLYGVPGPTFVREIQGTGRVFGIKFHPGAFYPWAPQELSSLFDHRVALLEALGPDWDNWARRVLVEPDLTRRVELTDQFLLSRRPPPPGEGHRCARRMIEDRTLLRVEDAATVLGHDVRSLQRLFRREVGASPKEVLRRYRLMEAADLLAQDFDSNGAALAARLGYVDQAHFIRDFHQVAGYTPGAYRRGSSNNSDQGLRSARAGSSDRSSNRSPGRE